MKLSTFQANTPVYFSSKCTACTVILCVPRIPLQIESINDDPLRQPLFKWVSFPLFQPMFYTINILTPCLTMSLLALLVFYLPPDSGEKVSLGITVLLSFSVFLLLVAENVPKTSEFVPLLGESISCILYQRLCSDIPLHQW